jgi:demethylmenaquinone methyltransferase/2-methoxy-6-polyprenyl-1,4-benzoquinol methylase
MRNSAIKQKKQKSKSGPTAKAEAVRGMFGAIAPRYDLLNHLLSLNRDRAWRRRAVDRLLEGGAQKGRYLDACAGTLDLSVELAKRPSFRGEVIASDFSYPMLRAGVAKQTAAIRAICGDALQQPFADRSFDGAMVGFGVRNLASVEGGLREFARLLRPGAKLVILEFTTPHWQPFRGLYLFYFQRVLPLVGRVISGHGTAYRYLPESVLQFPEPSVLAELMRTAGFTNISWETYTGGIVAAHVGTRR